MVFERMFPAAWLEKRAYLAFFLGVLCASIGILIARLIFYADASFVAIAFTSILLIPSLRKIFTIEEHQERSRHGFSFKNMFRDKGDFVKVYMSIAAGIFLVYLIASMLLPGFQVSVLFRDQLQTQGIISAHSVVGANFMVLLVNNLIAILAAFALAFFTGDGGIFFITWNASVWGTVFGVTARNAAIFSDANPWWYLLLILVVVLPHTILEMLAYVFASISGGSINADIRDKSFNWKKLFTYSSVLILLALVLLGIGVSLETYVLNHVEPYREIVRISLRL